MLIDLYTPSGIGDIYWILQKLARTAREQGARFKIHTPPGKGDKFARGKFLEYIDVVESTAPDGIPYEELKKVAKQYDRLESVMYCECNTWLESGQRLEHYLPAFPTEFVLNWEISEADRLHGESFLKTGKKNIVIYTSGNANNESSSTGKWKAAEWKPRIEALSKIENVNLIWIGANYDADLLQSIKPLFDSVLIDEPASVVLSLLRKCDGFISYQSGLSCISVVEVIPTFMLYFRKIEKLTHTFNPPASASTYRAAFFDDLPDFAEWVNALPIRGRTDYTEWVEQNIEKTETDWKENPWIHDDQYEAVKNMRGDILEVGCGSGQLASRFPHGHKYTGTDKSEALLALARDKRPDLRFFQSDVRKIEGFNLLFTNVCAFGFIKHFSLAEWPEVFAKLCALSSRYLFIETPIYGVMRSDDAPFPHSWVTREYIAEQAQKNGFTIESVVPNRSGEVIYTMKRT